MFAAGRAELQQSSCPLSCQALRDARVAQPACEAATRAGVLLAASHNSRADRT